MSERTNATVTSATRGAGSLLGRVVVRARWLLIAAWIVVTAVLSVAFPPLTQVVENQKVQPLPREAMAATEQMAKAFNESGQNILVAVLTDEQGLRPADEDVYRALAEKLRHDTKDVADVRDFTTTPALRQTMVSEDNKAFYMAIGLTASLGSPESAQAYERIAQTVEQSTHGGTLTAHVTGPGAIVGDVSIISARAMHVIEIATVLLVLAILLLIYRRPVTVLLPLVTIGVSVATAEGIVSALTRIGLQVSALTVVLMTAMIMGAGTDYAVFLISRYHEYVRRGMGSDLAVRHALGSMVHVIAASAATVAVTFLGMSFTHLPAFTTLGPALAVSIAVAFLAAVTLLPAIVVVAGRRGWIAPRRAVANRFWQRSAIHIVRRPKVHLLVGMTVLVALAACASLLHSNYDDRKQLPELAKSNVGYAAMERHFSTSSLVPEYIYIHSPHDLRTPQALADLEQMAQRVAQLPNIVAVRGITRPTGQPLEQAKVSFQAGEVGSKLDEASSQITNKTGDLDALSGGARQLADNLGSIRDEVNQAASSASAVMATLSQLQQQFGGTNALLDQIDTVATLVDNMRSIGDNIGPNLTLVQAVVNAAGPVLDALNTSPVCDANPACRDGRSNIEQLVQAGDNGAFHAITLLAQQLQGTQSLRAALASMATTLHGLGANTPGGVAQALARVQEGGNALADGSQRLADGVHTLVDQTKQMGSGLSEAADFLLTMKRDASQPSMAGIYIPAKELTTDNFKNAAKVFVSPDGHSVRYLVQTKLDPFNTDPMDQVASILGTARGAQPNTSLSDASISMVGSTPMFKDIRDYYRHDMRFIMVVTLLVVLLILIVLLRAIVAPLYLIASVVISYLSALGLGVLFFQFICHQPIYWSIPAMAFIVLVSVGADYNLLLITRIREESHSGIRSGTIRAVRSTGGVITSAGIIFAASMFGLLFGSITTMVQTGFIIGMGLLIDTFLVRTIMVPALAVLVGKANWWPSRHANGARSEATTAKRITHPASVTPLGQQPDIVETPRAA